MQNWAPKQLLSVLHVLLLDTMPDCNDTLDSLADACMRAVPAIWKQSLVDLEWVLMLCLSWLFPDSHRWGRCNRQIIAVTAFLDFAVALASLTHRAGLPLSAKDSHRHFCLVSRFWEPQLQKAFLLGGDDWGVAGTEWLRLVLQHSKRVDSDDNAEFGFVYLAGVSTKHRSYYVGYCGSVRQKAQHQFGLFQRWFDHKVREVRPIHGIEKRYKAWRNRAPMYANHMLPVFIGTKMQAWMREQFVIKSFTLPVQGWRQGKSRRRPSPSDSWKEPKLSSWQRTPLTKLQCCLLNVSNLMLRSWKDEVVDAALAEDDSSLIWTKLPWSSMVKLGIPQNPEIGMGTLHLWVCKLATRGTEIPWRAFTPTELVTMRMYADRLQNETRRSFACRRLATVLSNTGLYPLRPVWLSIPDATPSEASRMQKVIRGLLSRVSTASGFHAAIAKFWSRNLRIVRGKPQTLIQRFCNHRQVARSFDGRGDSQGGAQQLLFVDENLKTHAPQSSAHLLRQWAAKLSSWVLTSNIEAEVAVTACETDAHGVHPNTHQPDTAQSSRDWIWGYISWVLFLLGLIGDDEPPMATRVYRWLRAQARPRRRRVGKAMHSVIRKLRSVEVIVQQDKCPAAVVGMPRYVYDNLLYETFLCDPMHYKACSMPVEQILERQYFQHLVACPSWARRRRSVWKPEVLPYAYINIKRKCFNQTGCCCSKQHAHVREIISNCLNPLRRSLRVPCSAMHTQMQWQGYLGGVDVKRCPRAGEASHRIFETWLRKMSQVW